MSDFDDALEALEQKAASRSPAEVTTDDDLIPDAGSTYTPTEADLEIDRIVDGVDILDAYRRWCGKSDPDPRGRTEGIKVSCPNPDHPDTNPSAWINTDEQVYFCGACQEGGDKYTIAAFRFGYGPDYQRGRNFPELKRDMARDLGYTVEQSPLSGKTLIAPPAGAESSQGEDAGGPTSSTRSPNGSSSGSSNPTTTPVPDDDDDLDSLAAAFTPAPAPSNVVSIATGLEDDGVEDYASYPKVPWRDLLPPDTFLHRWMLATSQDDLPEEYYFWMGMQALGLAAGRQVTLADSVDVRSNLFVCLYGPSGLGKSRSVAALMRLLTDALPYDHDDEDCTGTYLVPSPGSAEALVDAFSKPIEDINGGPTRYAAVRGLVRFDELSTLIGRANRIGNPMKPMLMEFFDGYAPVEHKTRGMGHVRAENYYTQCVTSTQPGAVRKLLSSDDANSGFINRWIFAAGPPKTPISYGGASIDITPCVIPLRTVRAWAGQRAGHRMMLSGDALARWDKFFHDIVYPQKMNDPSGLLTRIDLMLKKIMLLFALNRGEEHPSLESVNDALALWDYLFASYGLISPQIGVTDRTFAFEAVEEHLKRYTAKHPGKGRTIRDIKRALSRKNLATEEIVRAVELMVKAGYLTETVSKGERGPSTMVYHFVAEGQ